MTRRTDVLHCIVDLQDMADRAEQRGQRRVPEVMRRAAELLAIGLSEMVNDDHPVIIIDQDASHG